MSKNSTRIVIVGGGAGGLELAIRLARNSSHEVWLVDSAATQLWKPRLHEIAAGARRVLVDEMEYASLAERWGFMFVQGELCDIDPEAHRIRLDAASDTTGHAVVAARSLACNVLVLAIGGVTPDLGVDGVREHAFVLDRAEDAEAVFKTLSLAALQASADKDHKPLPIVIVGTGLTGVELAAKHVETQDGEHFDSQLTVSATGRVGPPIAGQIKALATNKKRQWQVKDTLQTGASDDIFALGDSAVEGSSAPPTAQAASHASGYRTAALLQRGASRRRLPIKTRARSCRWVRPVPSGGF
jgi:NADH dehydrogenase FAD-containing subunit